MYKQGALHKAFKKRYFVLYPGDLVCYSDETKYRSDMAKGSLQVHIKSRVKWFTLVECMADKFQGRLHGENQRRRVPPHQRVKRCSTRVQIRLHCINSRPGRQIKVTNAQALEPFLMWYVCILAVSTCWMHLVVRRGRNGWWLSRDVMWTLHPSLRLNKTIRK